MAAPNINRPFTKIPGAANALISLPPSAVTLASNEPDLILVFSWMEAQLTHIQKYTEPYGKQYPGSTMILVRSYQTYWYTPTKTIINGLVPVAKKVEELNPKRVLVHCFSNGGSFALIDFIKAFQTVKDSQIPFPVSAIVLDSTPGTGEWSRGLIAFTAGVKSPLAKYVGMAFYAGMYAWASIYIALTGAPDWFDAMRKDLLDKANLQTTAPRAYIYSKTDQLIDYHIVEAHIADAKALGISVLTEEFEGTPHVQHMRSDPDRYWNIVQKTWKQGLAITDAQ